MSHQGKVPPTDPSLMEVAEWPIPEDLPQATQGDVQHLLNEEARKLFGHPINLREDQGGG